MESASSWRTLWAKSASHLKRLRSAFLKWPPWIKGTVVFGSSLLLFNALAASSYFSYRWQLESSLQIPAAREVLGLCGDALDQLLKVREMEKAYLSRSKGGSLYRYQVSLQELISRLTKLKNRVPAPGPNQGQDKLVWLGTQLLLMSRESTPSKNQGGVEILGMRIEGARPAAEKARDWALSKAREEGMLAELQGILQELRSGHEHELENWHSRAKNASRVFGASVLLGNLLAILLVSLGGHSLMFHISLGESSTQSLKELQLFVDSAAEAIVGVDLNGNCIFANRALLRLLGYEDAADLLGRPIRGVIFAPGPSSTETAEAGAVMDSLRDGRPIHRAEGLAWRSDGGSLAVEFWSNPMHYDGQLYGAAVTLQDISAALSARKKLERVNQSLQNQVQDLSRHSQEMSAFSELTEMLQASTSTDELCKVVTVFVRQLFPDESGALYVLGGAAKLLEPISVWGDAGLIGPAFAPEDCWSLRRAKPHYEEAGSEGLFCAHLPRPLPGYSFCLPLIAKGGSLGVLHLCSKAGTPHPGLSQSKQLLAVALAQQVALGVSNLRLRDFLREDSIRDALTGLYNRRYMIESLEHEVSRAARSGSSVGLVLFDLDYFKNVNDSQGHAVGDRLLSALGSLVKESIRSGDIACRYGGDEFLVILPGITLTQAMDLAEALRKKAEALMHESFGAGGRYCTLSLGVAMYPGDASSAETLQLAADRALYRAKEGGRNRVASAGGPP